MEPCYKVSLEQWSGCSSPILNSCGVATKRRTVHCVRDDGKIVADSFCPGINNGKAAYAAVKTHIYDPAG